MLPVRSKSSSPSPILSCRSRHDPAPSGWELESKPGFMSACIFDVLAPWGLPRRHASPPESPYRLASRRPQPPIPEPPAVGVRVRRAGRPRGRWQGQALLDYLEVGWGPPLRPCGRHPLQSWCGCRLKPRRAAPKCNSPSMSDPNPVMQINSAMGSSW